MHHVRISLHIKLFIQGVIISSLVIISNAYWGENDVPTVAPYMYEKILKKREKQCHILCTIHNISAKCIIDINIKSNLLVKRDRQRCL